MLLNFHHFFTKIPEAVKPPVCTHSNKIQIKSQRDHYYLVVADGRLGVRSHHVHRVHVGIYPQRNAGVERLLAGNGQILLALEGGLDLRDALNGLTTMQTAFPKESPLKKYLKCAKVSRLR